MKTKMFKSIWLPVMVLTLLTVFSSCQKEPTASFTVSSTSVNIGESVYFTNTSADADSYEWDFGDGGTSSFTSLSHIYNTAGTYIVTLTAFSKNEKKSDKATEAITVSVSQNQTGTLTDDRDGKIYNTVKIANQWWMAENLNIGTRINGVNDQTNNAIIEKYCYGDNTSNCNIYGGLYQWDEMMQYNPSDNGTIGTTQGVCPIGWHIPTDEEWKTLEMEIGMSQADADATGWRGTDEGGKLKETGTTHWSSPNTGATNESGFTALPGGYRTYYDGSFRNLGISSLWWSATEYSSTNAWERCPYYDYAEVYRIYNYKENGHSVRCVKD